MAKSDTRKALEAEYRKLAKRADQRLVRLETYAGKRKGSGKETKKAGYEGITQYAYKNAMRDIRSWSGDNAKRFNTKPPSNTNQLKAKIKDIEKFLNSASSTLKGIQNVYEKRANTLNQKYGIDMNWKQLAKFFESGLNDRLSEQIKDSDTKMRVIAEIRKNRDEIKDMFKGNDAHLDIEDDVVAFEVENLLNAKGLKSSVLLK